MPLYDYECEQCHRHTEKIQKFSDAPLTECPHCGGHIERVLHAPAVAFKGGGWYADGYGSKKPGGAGESSKSESKSEAKGSESKSGETKSDAGSKSTESSSSTATAPSAPAASTATASAASSSSSDKK